MHPQLQTYCNYGSHSAQVSLSETKSKHLTDSTFYLQKDSQEDAQRLCPSHIQSTCRAMPREGEMCTLTRTPSEMGRLDDYTQQSANR